MTQAIVNPEELRRFANLLREMNADLQDKLRVLIGQFEALGETWRDQEHEKFREQFLQYVHMAQQFVEANEEHIPFLLRKAERIEEYLNQR
ncbi:MAG: hypothetical protein KatS3mg114_1109 [Planctomycetaceae bacterium]|nr:MAG: hypothetical protein KatS3mg114_1109 [Planctomycetaceae bacterium]